MSGNHFCMFALMMPEFVKHAFWHQSSAKELSPLLHHVPLPQLLVIPPVQLLSAWCVVYVSAFEMHNIKPTSGFKCLQVWVQSRMFISAVVTFWIDFFFFEVFVCLLYHWSCQFPVYGSTRSGSFLEHRLALLHFCTSVTSGSFIFITLHGLFCCLFLFFLLWLVGFATSPFLCLFLPPFLVTSVMHLGGGKQLSRLQTQETLCWFSHLRIFLVPLCLPLFALRCKQSSHLAIYRPVWTAGPKQKRRWRGKSSHASPLACCHLTAAGPGWILWTCFWFKSTLFCVAALWHWGGGGDRGRRYLFQVWGGRRQLVLGPGLPRGPAESRPSETMCFEGWIPWTTAPVEVLWRWKGRIGALSGCQEKSLPFCRVYCHVHIGLGCHGVCEIKTCMDSPVGQKF